MKLESKSKQFEPLVITIESEDELRTLWHALRVNSKNWLEGRCLSKPNELQDVNMFCLVDDEVDKRGLKND